jgi:phosphatidylcholine synthase
MKEVEGEAYFLRFPSYWNVLVLYLYWLRPPEIIVISLLTTCMVLSFIPTRYLYPSKNPKYPLFTIGLALIWVPMMLLLLSQHEPNPVWVIVSMFYPIYYMGMSFYIELRYRTEGTEQIPVPN